VAENRLANGIDCMSCLVKLARGCPTNGGSMMRGRIVCATVLTDTQHDSDSLIVLPAHVFTYSNTLGQWMSFEHWVPRKARRNQ